MGSGERARHWRYPGLPGVDLLRARYIGKRFTPHTHESYVIAGITEGVEEFQHRDALERVGPGGLALVNPDTPHTGHAGVPEGWRYDVIYPSVATVADIAAETTTIRGMPAFTTPVAHDPYLVRLVSAVCRATEQDDPLASDILLRILVTRLLRQHGGRLLSRPVRSAGARDAAQARAILLERMTRPPTLKELAAELDTGPFALLRAFRAAYGMPPHTWLTDVRVHRARALLEAGTPPAETALAVGFTDQPHLSRHFSRIVGVPPGAYQRERARTYKNGRGTGA